MRIDQFLGRYFFLSTSALSSAKFDGDLYPSVAQAFAAAKTLDLDVRARLRGVRDPAKTNKLDRQGAVRPDWDAVKIGIMRQLLRDKFSEPKLAEALLDTGDAELVEGNLWGDAFWGLCQGRGENMLGLLLMQVRSEIRAARAVSKGSGPAPSR